MNCGGGRVGKASSLVSLVLRSDQSNRMFSRYYHILLFPSSLFESNLFNCGAFHSCFFNVCVVLLRTVSSRFSIFIFLLLYLPPLHPCVRLRWSCSAYLWTILPHFSEIGRKQIMVVCAGRCSRTLSCI